MNMFFNYHTKTMVYLLGADQSGELDTPPMTPPSSKKKCQSLAGMLFVVFANTTSLVLLASG